MKITKKIDQLGRIIISKDIREAIGIELGSEVEMIVQDKHLIISSPKKKELKEYIKASVEEYQRMIDTREDMLPNVKHWFEAKIEALNDVLDKM